MALDGCHLMSGHNSQPKVLVNSEGVLERRRDRGGTSGGRCPIVWGIEWRQATKKREMGWALAIEGGQLNILHTTTNRKQASVTEGTMKGRRDEREAWGKHNTIVFGRHNS